MVAEMTKDEGEESEVGQVREEDGGREMIFQVNKPNIDDDVGGGEMKKC